MAYEVRLSRKAESYYKRADADTRNRLQACFNELERTPTDWQHPQIKRLRGRLAGLWRYRVGDLRTIYEVNETDQVVYVVTIGPRGDIYRS